MDIPNISMPTLERTEAIATLEPITEHLATQIAKPQPSIASAESAHKSTAKENALNASNHNIDHNDVEHDVEIRVSKSSSTEHENAISLHIEYLISGIGDPDLTIASKAMQALVELGSAAVPSLITAIDNYKNNARIYAVKALAEIGDWRSLDLLIQATQPDELMLSVRRAAIVGLGKINWQDCSNNIDNAEAIANQKSRILDVLAELLTDQSWSIRYAAVVALAELSKSQDQTNSHINTLINNLLCSVCAQEAEPVVKTRASLVFNQQPQQSDRQSSQPELMAIGT
jgi:hypothetical protein